MSVLPLHLRAYQEPTRDELTRLYFNVPPQEWVSGSSSTTLVKTAAWVAAMSDRGKEAATSAPGSQGMEISAILSVEGKDEVYSGRLNLLPPFLCFVSLDKRSARFSIPLYTIRRVERLNSRAGVFALSLATWHGMRLILQLTSLLPTAEHFSILLRDALKSQLAEMKRLKTFTPSLYSEFLLSPEASSARASVSNAVELIDVGPSGSNPDRDPSSSSLGDLRGPGGEGRGTYERGLGESFGYPGDPRKLRERSKIKLWREYFQVHGRNLTRELPVTPAIHLECV